MRKHQLPHTDIWVTEICLGTMIFGEQVDESSSLDIMDSAIKECGINFLDTAELYPVPPKSTTTGDTDRIIGKWLRDNPSYRDAVVIGGKVVAYSAQLDYFRGGPQPTKQHFRQCLDDILGRLGVDTLDLYQIHWPARNTPMFGGVRFDPKQERTQLDELGLNLYEQAEAMNDFIKEGKIRSWGLSNENSWGVMKFVQICEEHGLQKPSTLQNAYSLLNRTFEAELWEVCFRENIGFLPYSPLAMGHLTGKYLGGEDEKYPVMPKEPTRLSLYQQMGSRYSSSEVGEAARLRSRKPFARTLNRYAGTDVEEAVRAYQELASDSGHSLAAFALAFVNQRPFVTSNIIGVSNVAQLQENLKSLAVELGGEWLRRLDQIHAVFPNPCP